MLIDCSFFTKGRRHILNVTYGTMPNQDAIDVNEVVEAYISELQEEFLVRMLGSRVGHKVNAYLVCIDEDELTKRYAAIDAVCDRLRESFAFYVFYHILRDANTQPTIKGLVTLKGANEHVSPLRRQVCAWNDMVKLNRDFVAWCATQGCTLSGITIDPDMCRKINSFNL